MIQFKKSILFFIFLSPAAWSSENHDMTWEHYLMRKKEIHNRIFHGTSHHLALEETAPFIEQPVFEELKTPQEQYEKAKSYKQEQDFHQAFHYFNLAALQGHREAQYQLGLCYENAWGVDRDEEKLFQWYKKAADQNHPKALWAVAMCYKFGVGVEKNERIAFRHFNQAAELGNVVSQFACARYYEDGKIVRKDRRKAFELYHQASRNGETRASYHLASMHLNGIGVKKNEKKAVALYQQLANQNHADSQFALGEYFQGRNNYEKAFSYYQKAADQNHAEAQFKIGGFYRGGIGVFIDNNKAFEYLKKSAENGFRQAEPGLYSCYVYGIGCQKDIPKAARFFENLQDLSLMNGSCFFDLGSKYLNGVDVSKDVLRGLEFLKKGLKAPLLDGDKERLHKVRKLVKDIDIIRALAEELVLWADIPLYKDLRRKCQDYHDVIAGHKEITLDFLLDKFLPENMPQNERHVKIKKIKKTLEGVLKGFSTRK
jgi:TPR repeat protein